MKHKTIKHEMSNKTVIYT